MTHSRTILSRICLLELADRLGNAAQACRMLGYSRNSFYRFRRLYASGGLPALAAASRRLPPPNNRSAPELEQAIIAIAVHHPAWGQFRAASALARRGLTISPAGVRSVWLRNDLATMKDRLQASSARAEPEAPHQPGNSPFPATVASGRNGMWSGWVRNRLDR